MTLDAADYDHNLSSIAFARKTEEIAVKSSTTLNCSFMYTQMLKEILLTLDFNEEHFKEFPAFCRKSLTGNSRELQKVDKIEKEYSSQSNSVVGIWIFSLFDGLHMMEVDLIVTMGFFYSWSTQSYHHTLLRTIRWTKLFRIIRDQGFSQADFDQLKASEGGLLAFNDFLSTSLNSETSLQFARDTIRKSHIVDVLFVMKIDRSASKISFAKVRDVSFHRGWRRDSFSYAFDVSSGATTTKWHCIWQVDLTLCDENDPQLQILAKMMKDETSGSTGWYRLGELLM